MQTDALDKGLPSAVMAERALLGSILSESQRYAEIRDVVTVSDFSIDKHRKIWRRAGDLFEAGSTIDRVTVATRLHQVGELEAVDGISYLIELEDQSVPLPNVESYAAAIVEAATRRRVIVTAQQLIAQAVDSTPVTALLDNAKAMLNGLMPSTQGEFSTPGEIVMDAGGLDSYLAQFRASGIPWPWAALTEATGGLFPGELAIIAAGPGGGKTDWALNVALHFAQQGRPGAIFGLEMSKKQQVNRVAAMASGKFNRALVRHELRDYQVPVVAEAFGTIADLPLFISHKSTHTVMSIEAGLRRLKARHDIQWAAVDYLQLVEGKGRSRTEEVGSVANGLKLIAGELGIGMIVPAQINREPIKAGAEPGLHDLRESGSIEQAANIAAFLHVSEKIAAVNDPSIWVPIDLLLKKQRDGASNFAIKMQWQKSTGRFREAT